MIKRPQDIHEGQISINMVQDTNARMVHRRVAASY